jgi:serine/threonine-protein kinase PRP4
MQQDEHAVSTSDAAQAIGEPTSWVPSHRPARSGAFELSKSSAVDDDADVDMLNDDEMRAIQSVPSRDAGDGDNDAARVTSGTTAAAATAATGAAAAGTADDEDDMFGASPKPGAGAAAGAGAGGEAEIDADVTNGVSALMAGATRTADDWDDAEGYYRHQQGEILSGRFQVLGVFGKGVFSTVLKAREVHDPSTLAALAAAGAPPPPETMVALKMVRANATMAKAAEKEEAVLRRLEENDKQGRRHCVRLLSRFEHRGHFVFAFEAMSMNLRSVVHKYGKSVGLNLGAVRVYARQLVSALRHLERCGVVHADIKPDNIIVNDAKTALRIW